MKNLIKNGQKIYMVPNDVKGGLSTIINKIVGTTIVAQVSEGDIDFYSLGDVIEVFTVINDGILYFKPRVVGIDKVENIIKIEFDKEKYEQLQRREYTRIDMQKEFTLKCGEESIICVCLDLSAGGMKFETTKKIDVNKDYPIEFSLESKIPISCYFQPIRVVVNGKGKNKKNIVSGRFVAIKNIDKIAIVQYCFRKQSENINK